MKEIISAEHFIGTKFPFSKVAQFCKLEPIKNWQKWKDDDNNIFVIRDNGNYFIKKSYVEQNTTTDIFKKADVLDIIKFSTWISLFSNEHKSIICLLGKDGVLRSCYLENKVWKYNFNSLLLGISTLKLIANSLNKEYGTRIVRIFGNKYINNLSGLIETNQEKIDKWLEIK